MTLPYSLEAISPALSIQSLNFTQEDPGIVGWRWLFDQAEGADAAGIDRLVMSDHIVLGESLDEYADPKKGGIQGGQQPTNSEGHWLDPIVTLSMFAARTQHTRIMTGILLAGLRRPATLAKMLSTLDVLSEGRLDVGVGVGWQHQEYDANGVSFKGRGEHLNDTLEICQTLWRETSAHYQSASVDFEKIHLNPKPLQKEGVPIWVSGRLNAKVLERIVKFGSGWIPWGDHVKDPVNSLATVYEELDKNGRSKDGFQCTSHIAAIKDANGQFDIAASLAPVGALAEGGITDIRLTLPLPREKSATEDMLSPWVDAFRKEVGRD